MRKKRLRFTKKQVIEAILTEPLEKGKWISGSWHNSNDFYRKPARNFSNTACKVCAVGAVLRRNTDLTPFAINDFGSKLRKYTVSIFAEPKDIRYLVRKKKWLAALSAKFETQEGNIDESFRKKLVTWVKRNFPERFSTMSC